MHFRQRMLIALGVGVLASMLPIMATSVDRQISGPLGKIAYVQSGDLWSMPLPGGARRHLTQDGENAFPRWSSSGRWVLFNHGVFGLNTENWVMKGDGSARRRLDAVGVGQTQWSPVADELLYVRPDGAVVSEAADGGPYRIVLAPYSSATEAGQIAGGLWSPDGKSLLYLEERWQLAAPVSAANVPALRATPPTEARTYVGLGRVAADGSGRKEIALSGSTQRTRSFRLVGPLTAPPSSSQPSRVQRLPTQQIKTAWRCGRSR